ncbi:MAG: hypothetical protein ACRD12_21895 [Acidimicrobiales bacterium]
MAVAVVAHADGRALVDGPPDADFSARRELPQEVRKTILIGHMAADVAVAACVTVPIMALGLILGARFGGAAGRDRVHGARLAVEAGLRRLRLRHRPQDWQPGQP